MITEKYNLITKGELLAGYSKEVVCPRLALLFKVDEQSISRIFVNKKIILKKNVTWERALQYREKLKNIGLLIYIDVILKANNFRESLVSVENKSDVDENIAVSSKFLYFDNKKINPVIAYLPHTETIYDKKEIPQFNLQSFNHKINFKFIIIVSLVTSLLIQKYIAMILVSLFSGTVVTVMSVIIFILIVLFLPKIMMPNRIFTLRESKKDIPYLLCIQNSSYNIFIDSYLIYSPSGDYLTTITNNKLKSFYQCFDEHDNIVFTSSEEHDIDDFTKGVTKDLRDEIFDFSVLTYLNSLSKQYKKFQSWLKKQPQTYLREDAYIIRDNKHKKIAYYYRDKNSAIELPDGNFENKEHKILMAFLLICVGVD